MHRREGLHRLQSMTGWTGSRRSSSRGLLLSLLAGSATVVGWMSYLPATAWTSMPQNQNLAHSSLEGSSSISSTGSFSDTADDVSRRRGVLAALAAATLTGAVPSGIALAAGPPPFVEVTGIPAGANDFANGRWGLLADKEINGKAVYRQRGRLVDGKLEATTRPCYLVVNDCGQYQLTENLNGKCNGFAKKIDGAWTVEGKPAKDIKIKPVAAKGATEIAKPKDEETSPSEAIFGFKMEEIFEDVEKAFNDDPSKMKGLLRENGDLVIRGKADFAVDGGQMMENEEKKLPAVR
eukprot:TRINITY_DN13338_c0_g1_i1.p1 TRINITY_DN13338_c0_g1~~TRINITY_DN13338_c0_g1_i1.p1  ORF type:complete len:294 (-),score=60.59 TRINITY_DN13338_c0_g1_i1:198-1079(-)